MPVPVSTRITRQEEAIGARRRSIAGRFCESVEGRGDRSEMSFILAKVEAEGPKTFLMDLTLLENRFAFQRND
jgi:hypothetical protein